MLEAFVRNHSDDAHGLAVIDLNDNNPSDSEAISAATNPNCENRREIMTKWLARYRVFVGISSQCRSSIVECILEYMDNCDVEDGRGFCNHVIELERHCIDILNNPENNGNRTYHNLSVLASKALWCKYPAHVPIFDGHARRGIIVLSKICEARYAEHGREYCRYARAWYDVYNMVAHVIEDLNQYRYPYNVRLFDKLLWRLGEPKYGVLAPNQRLPAAAE